MSLLLFIVPHKATGIPHWKAQKIPFQKKIYFGLRKPIIFRNKKKQVTFLE